MALWAFDDLLLPTLFAVHVKEGGLATMNAEYA